MQSLYKIQTLFPWTHFLKSSDFCLIHLTFKRFFNICIVGSGPAGFYTATHLLSENKNVSVDMYEKYPVPYGLIRYGVAPDHPQIKNVENTFSKVATSGRCHFYGNVDVGKDISVEQLLKAYNAVVLCYGADANKELGIPGEQLGNVLSARTFVGWYNGAFENVDEKINLDTDVAAVIGHGNVALDVARILLRNLDELKTTDIADHAYEVLKKSRIKKIILIGRRGPLQVAFTVKEFREITKLPGCHVSMHSEDFEGIADLIPSIVRPRKRLTELLVETLEKSKQPCSESKDLELKFFRNPKAFLPNVNNDVEKLVLTINKIEGSPNSGKVISTQKEEILNCGLVLKSVGYQSTPVDPIIPFDLKRHIVPNEQGSATGVNGLYCSGWVKSGPKGVIPKTISDSYETAEKILHDFELKVISKEHRPGSQTILELLKHKGVKVFTFDHWLKINEVEQERGKVLGKPRQKIVTVPEMLRIARL